MTNNHYPLVDTQFIVGKLLNSGKIITESKIIVGSTITFLAKGSKPIHKRIIRIREINGEVNYMQATALAILYGFMGDLLDWYRENKKWNEGGYTVR